MGKLNEKWDVKLERLIAEIIDSEKIYGTLVQSDRYPRQRPLFKRRHFKQQHNSHILTDEFHTIIGRDLTKPQTLPEPIFKSMQTTLLEKNLTDSEVAILIIAKEQALLRLYQDVLTYPELPNTTNAIVQAQAEDLNNTLQGLRLDHRINSRTDATYA